MRYVSYIETKVINKLFKSAKANGAVTCSVFDEEEWSVKRGTFAEAKKEIGETGSEELIFRDADGNKLGWFWLIHGNEGHVITDYTANEWCDKVMEPVNAKVEEMGY